MGVAVANLLKCKRCGKDLVGFLPHATNQRFCGSDCRETWWNEFRSKGVTRGEWATRRFGAVEKRDLPLEIRTWLAALVDGEGTISIWRERRKGNASGFGYHAVVEIYNTNLNLLNQAVELLDGFVAKKGFTLKHHKMWHKPCFKVVVNRRAVAYLLEQIAPHLRAKQKQAEVVQQFCRMVEEAPMRTSLDHGMFEQLYLQVKALNKRGVEQNV